MMPARPRMPRSAETEGLTMPPEILADDPFPATPDGEQPGLISLSDEGIKFLVRHEGLRLALYNDSEGHCTIGVGHLVHKGSCDGSEPDKFKAGLTEEAALNLLRDDLDKFETAISGGITSRINQYQYDAFV